MLTLSRCLIIFKGHILNIPLNETAILKTYTANCNDVMSASQMNLLYYLKYLKHKYSN